MIDENRQDQAVLFALGLLPDAEREDFEGASEADVDLTQFCDELRQTAELLPYAVTPVAPKPELRATILMSLPPPVPKPKPSVIHLARLAVTPRSGALGFGRWLAAAVAIAACIILAALWQGEKGRGRILEARLARTLDQSNRFADEVRDESAESRHLATALATESEHSQKLAADLQTAQEKNRTLSIEAEAHQQELESSRLKTAEMAAEIEKAKGEFQIANAQVVVLTSLVKTQPGAKAVSLWDGNQQRGVLIVQGLPPLPADRDYQLWVIDPQQKAPIDAGVFQITADSQEQFGFKPKAEVAGGSFAVTVEPKGGVPAPTGQMVLKGN